jgi:DNA-binding GntR family transcriptional regulator
MQNNSTKKNALNGNSRAETIYSELRDRICLLHYKPGTVLREADLADEFNVSRTPVRQALQRLQVEELVETKKAVGSIVTGYTFETLKDAYEVRVQILDVIANISIGPYTKRDISDMEHLLAQAKQLTKGRQFHEYWHINNSLNKIIGRLIDNDVLKSIYDSLYYQTARNWFQYVEELWSENIEMLTSEIEEEIKQMKIGDTRGALMVRRNYILLFLSTIERCRSEQNTSFVE